MKTAKVAAQRTSGRFEVRSEHGALLGRFTFVFSQFRSVSEEAAKERQRILAEGGIQTTVEEVPL